MNRVTISNAEMIQEPNPWPGATYENRLAVLMTRKGLRMRPSVDPKPEDLEPPWHIEENRDAMSFVIWQGEKASAPDAAQGEG